MPPLPQSSEVPPSPTVHGGLFHAMCADYSRYTVLRGSLCVPRMRSWPVWTGSVCDMLRCQPSRCANFGPVGRNQSTRVIRRSVANGRPRVRDYGRGSGRGPPSCCRVAMSLWVSASLHHFLVCCFHPIPHRYLYYFLCGISEDSLPVHLRTTITTWSRMLDVACTNWQSCSSRHVHYKVRKHSEQYK